MWIQEPLFEGVICMNETKQAPAKKMFSVYIDASLISRIKEEAANQSRKISAQTEVFLRQVIKNQGDDS